MTTEESFLSELSEITGVAHTCDEDGLCIMEADGRSVSIRYVESDDVWMCFCMVRTPLPPSEEQLRKALSLNCFGTGTAGFHLGLFGDSLILAGRAAASGLGAEDFAERILLLVRTAGSLEKTLADVASSEVSAPDLKAYGIPESYISV